MKRKRRLRDVLVERLAAPIFALVILALWQAAIPLFGLSEFVLPTPWAIVTRIVHDFPLLMSQATYTLYEVVAGFTLAVAIGIPLSLGIFYWRTFERAAYPMLVALQTIPKVALAPLLVLYFGYGWAPKICLVFLISFFPIVISTVVGLQSLEMGLVNLVRSMGASEWQTFIKVRLPAALPSAFGGFKVAISLAVIGAIIGEYVASSEGLGYLQLQSNARFDTTLNFATVVVISLMGVLLYFIIGFVETRVIHQRESAR
jgi:NitT/TauT family transport system permease protein